MLSLSIQKRPNAGDSIVVGFIVMTIAGVLTKMRGMIKTGKNGLWADFSMSNPVDSRRNPGQTVYLTNVDLDYDLQQQCNAVVREFWDREEDHIEMDLVDDEWVITDIGQSATTAAHAALKFAAKLSKKAMEPTKKGKEASATNAESDEAAM